MKTINLGGYRPGNSTSFVGRPQGEEVRRRIGLNKYDAESEEVQIVIPEDTTSFNPSFFLGLLYDSIKVLGSVENFRKRYQIVISNTNPVVRRALQKNIDDGFRHATNSLEGKNGLSIFQ